jgi:Pyruvate/2-oxoacid:ferredoxin oxidoreductase delta subunit
VVRFEEINTDYFCSIKRLQPSSLPPASSIRSFDEVDRSLDACQAVQEAGRCFNCGICNGCDNCRTFCPEVAVIQDRTRRRINADYCKGCGVCVVECPRSAMVMEDAQS